MGSSQDSDVKLKITTDTAQAEAGLNGFSSKLKNLETDTAGFAGRIGSFVGGFGKLQVILAAAQASLAGLAMKSIEVGAANERYAATLATLTGSQEAANAKFRELNEFARKTPFQIDEVVKSYTMLRSYGLNPTIETMRTLGDASSAIGGGADTFEGIARALGQIQTKGKVSAEELMQLAERGIPAYEILREKLGLSASQVADIGNQAISSDKAISALFEGMAERYGGQMEKLQGTWTGVTEELKSLWRDAMSYLADSGLFEGMKNSLKGIRDWVSGAFESGKIQEWAKAISFAAQTVLTLAEYAMKLRNMGSYIGEGLKGVRDYLWAESRSLREITGAAKIEDWFNGWMEAGRQLESSQERLKKSTGSLSSEIGNLGIKGVKTWADFEAAEKKGEILYDQTTKKWVSTAAARVKAEMEAAGKVKATVDALEKMSQTIGKMGELQLKWAGDTFKESLEKPLTLAEEATKDNRTELERLKDAYKTYLQTVEDVYGRQLTLQEKVKAALLASKAPVADITKQMTTIRETEVKSVSERLAVQQRYYDELKNRHKSAYDEMIASQKTLNDLVKDMADSRKQTEDLLYEAWDKANPAKDAMEAWQRKASRLDEQAGLADTLKGADRVKALQDIQRAWASLDATIEQSETVRRLLTGGDESLFGFTADFADVTITKTISMYDTIRMKIGELGEQIATTQNSMKEEAEKNLAQQTEAVKTLGQAMLEAGQAINVTKTELQNLDSLLTAQRTLSIDVSGALASVQSVISAINSIPVGSSQPAASEAPMASPVESSSPSWPGYATGTNYVPRTGLYILHQGEKVTPAAQSGTSSRPITVSMGGITVVAGSGESAEDLARRIVKPVQAELRRLKALQ